ncbi:MAG: hypothetical protein PHO20_03420 [Candidatus Peribacteraceae bacterium]|nr:hypothetical protein [Candidatus Peribacteraceae bacterium]MDD5739792.1 hypothetical protein [Candidatus Peribacteraceae bacterium]
MNEDQGKSEFVYQQAKLRLDASTEAAETLEKKAFTLISLIIPLMNILLGYAIVAPKVLGEVVWFFSWLYALTLAGCLGILAYSISPWDWNASGNDPDSLHESEVYGQSLPNLILGEALTYQSRINKNQQNVENKGIALQRVIYTLAFGPLVSLAVAWGLSLLF